MSLLSQLGTAVQGIDAETYAMGITGQNISNLNNSSYTDESVVFDDLGSVDSANGPVSLGVSTSAEQMTNPLLNAQVVSENSTTSSYNTQQQLLEDAQTALEEGLTNTSTSSSTSSTDVSSSGLSTQIDNFFDAFEGYAASPTSSVAAQAVLAQAAALTETFQQTNSNLAQVQTGITSQIQSSVSDANTQLQTIATLNGQITQLNASSPGSASSLIDERQAALVQLASDVPITTTTEANGSVQVSMSDTSGNSVVLVNGSTVTGPLAFSGTTLTGGSSSAALQITSGSIYGALNVQEGALKTIQSSIDAVANQIVTAVNSAYSSSGQNFFDPSGTTAGTISVASTLNASTLVAGTGTSGDNSIALAISAIPNTSYSTANGDAIDGTIDGYYAGAVSSLGDAVSNMGSLAENQTAVQNLVESQVANVSGVSMDEEMGNLMKYENAYQANARYLSTVNDLLADLVENLGSAQ